MAKTYLSIFFILLRIVNILVHVHSQRSNNNGNIRVGSPEKIDTEDMRFNKFYFPLYTLGPRNFKPLKKAVSEYIINKLTSKSFIANYFLVSSKFHFRNKGLPYKWVCEPHFENQQRR